MADLPLFRRIIVGLNPGTIDSEAVEFVAELANLLGVVLQGVFVEDQAISGIGGLAHAREFRLVGYEWRPIETKRLAEDMRLAALSARRLLDQAAQRLGVASFFEVLRGEPIPTLVGLAHPTDILVVVAPKSPHEQLAPHYLRSVLFPGFSATAIFVPRRIGRRKGPVVALVETPHDRNLSVAAAIARAAGERLLILGPDDRRLRQAILSAAGVAGAKQARTEFVTLTRMDMQALLEATAAAQERLIVLTRPEDNSADDFDPFVIASLRQSPIIWVGPATSPEASL